MEEEFEEELDEDPEKIDPEEEGAVVCFECGYQTYLPGYDKQFWECSHCRRR